ncbi:hypothetical protein RJO92_003102 [Enterobacter asburiae]|nr:hypothetical protein [Enterobacter asburiae]
MFYDDFEFEREQEVIDFINNKIKRCRKCGNELHYKEKFHNTDKICNGCKGMRSFDEIDVTPPATQNQNNRLTTIRNTGAYVHPLMDNDNEKKRTTTENEFLKKYSQWQLNNEKAEKAWRENQKLSLSTQKQTKKIMANPKVTDERLGELINNYDLGIALDIRHDEIISITWEILYHRGVNQTF